MPIYEYQCSHCSQKQEVIQKVTDNAPEECPLCHEKGGMHKTITAGSFHLKGGGWYKDLYASPKKDASSGCGANACGNKDQSSKGCGTE